MASGDVLGAGRGQNGYRWHHGSLGAPKGCWGHQGVLGVLGSGRECQYSGARRDIGEFGAPGGCWGMLGVSGGYW